MWRLERVQPPLCFTYVATIQIQQLRTKGAVLNQENIVHPCMYACTRMYTHTRTHTHTHTHAHTHARTHTHTPGMGL